MTDGFGDHQVVCGGIGDLIHRHNSHKDIIFFAAQSAALAPRKKVPSVVLLSSSRPANIFLPCCMPWKSTAFVVTVISPLQQLTIQGASVRLLLVMQSLSERIGSFVDI